MEHQKDARRRPVRRRRVRIIAVVCLLGVVLAGADLSRPPSRQFSTRAALSAIRWYQTSVSPRIGSQCRFSPTCSVYARAVIERHGALRGGWMAVKRIARCGPWTKAGTVDRPE